MLRLKRNYSAQARTASGTNILLGIWLIMSPWVFEYNGRAAVLSSVFVGALVALFAAFRLASLHNSTGLSGINLFLALWTIGSPWACGYIENLGGKWNSVVVGVVIAGLAIWSASATMAEGRHPPGVPVS
jgi:hypothetical protein